MCVLVPTLPVQEYIRALDDSTAALALDSNHVKSLLRRATAANALGKHKLAETDLTLAASLEPHNKQVRMCVCVRAWKGGVWMCV